MQILGIWILLISSLAEAKNQAFDWSYLKELQKKAISLDLANEPGWLLRSYYKPRWGGGFKSQIDGESFFLSSRGKVDPQSELLATLESFFDSETNAEELHPQCLYISRRNFLFSKLNPDLSRLPKLPCQKVEDWKKKLDPNAISLVFAAAYMNNSASLFGHTFIKFHTAGNNEERDLLNYGVSFAASMNGGLPLFGLFGGYPGHFAMSPYHETLRSYVDLEGRDIFEYKLRFSKSEIEQMVDHLLEIQQTYFDYYFFDENCAYQILAMMDIARPSLHLTDFYWYQVIPADTVRLIANRTELVEKRTYRPSLQSVLNHQIESLSTDQQWTAKSYLFESYQSLQNHLEKKPLEEKRKTLDLALSYGAILEYREPDKWREINYKIRVERAKLSVPTRDMEPKEPPAVELGHESNLIRSDYGDRNGDSYLGFEFRPAYHDLMAASSGYSAHSQLELLRTRIQRSLKADQPWILREASLLKLQSGFPANIFFQPLSWKASFGFERAEEESELGLMNMVGGAGFGYTLGGAHWGWYNFAEARAEHSIEQFRFWPGVSSQAFWEPIESFRFLGSLEYRQSLGLNPKTLARAKLGVSFNVLRNFEIRAENDQYRGFSDRSISALWYSSL